MLFCCLSVGVFSRFKFQEKAHNEEHAYQTCQVSENTVSCNAVHQIAGHAAHSHHENIGNLGRHMVYVMALGPRRGQNGGIGNRRYMVAAYRTGQHGSHRHNHKMGIIGHDSQYDRNEDTEGAPGSTGSKSKANGHQEKQAGSRMAMVALSATTLPT